MKLALILILAFCALGVSAQSNECALGKTRLDCLAGWTNVRSGNDGKSLVADHAKAKVTLFATVLSPQDVTKESYDLSLSQVVKLALSLDGSGFRFKNSPDFWGDSKYSKYEETKAGRALFESTTNRFFHIHYVVFSFEEKKYLVGFARLMFEGEGADTRFNRWMGGGGSGDRELQELIFAVTKEETSSETPGGPPPAAGPRIIPGGPPPAKRPPSN